LRARTLAALALLALSSGATAARAEEIRVLLIPSGAGDPVAAHVLDELVALGLTVEVTPAATQELADLAGGRRVRAVLRVSPSRRAIDLWVDSAAGVERIEEPPEAPGAAGLALRAVELLRGRLLSVQQPATATASVEARALPPIPAALPGAATPPPPGPAVAAQAPARAGDFPQARTSSAAPDQPAAPLPPVLHTRLSLQVGPGVVVHPGSGISAGGMAVGGARWMLTPRWGGDFLALVPVVPAIVASEEGRARLSAVVIGAGAWATLLDPAHPIAMGVGFGLGAGFLSYYGQPETPRVRGRDGTVPYFLPFARWGMAWRALPPLSLRADAVAGVAAPRPVIRVAGRGSDAIFGQPLLTFALGLEVAIR
jgi:hypothetical protein